MIAFHLFQVSLRVTISELSDDTSGDVSDDGCWRHVWL